MKREGHILKNVLAQVKMPQALPPPQARNTLSIFLRNNNNRIRQSRIFQALRALPDFYQKDAKFFIKLHIQVYPCHHVLECR